MTNTGSTRRAFCGILFFLKVGIALALALSILGYYGLLVYQRYEYAMYESNLQQTRDRLGIKPPVVVFRPGQCNAVVGTSSVQNNRRISTGHRLEPPPGQGYYGFALDFARDDVGRLVERLGNRAPAVINAFTVINTTFIDKSQLNWWASDCGKVGAILQVTLDPNEPVQNIPDSQFIEFAQYLRQLTSQYGTPMIIRYGHEMNGFWRVNYGMKPIAYVRTFRVLANALKEQTNMTAMLWNPNVGTGYPYGATVNDLPPAGSADFKALDTNNDNVIDAQDDPYLPYYPGDEYVDWVGMSLYQYYINRVTDVTYLRSAINPTEGVLRNFYTRFSEERGKPMALGECGAPYISTLPSTSSELRIKQSWWSTLLQAGIGAGPNAEFPNLKMFINFEESKAENFDDMDTGVKYTDVVKDYRISWDTNIRNAFLADITAAPAFKWAYQLNYTCDGGVTSS